MTVDRRALLGASAMFGAMSASAALAAGPQPERSQTAPSAGKSTGLRSSVDEVQTERLQALLDDAQRRGATVELPAGRFKTGTLRLSTGAQINGAGMGLTVLELAGNGPLLHADRASDVVVSGLTLDGAMSPLGTERGNGLIAFAQSSGVELRRVTVTRSTGHGILLTASSGRIVDCMLSYILESGIHALDSKGLEIAHNNIADCANNGIQVWRSETGEDGTIVHDNRIERVRADAGGTGQNGNGINVYRAGSVIVANNRVTDCAYSAVRGNAASNIQILGNSCQRIGEVALYAEFAFEGAVIASNLVDTAATGVSVTNFEVGGRLAVIQGNLIRNLFRREQEPVDKRGEGIAVEADAAISGNVVEGAPTAGILLGWGRYMRDIAATGNTVRGARVGIAISSDASAGTVLVANNLISGARDGAIRAHDRGALIGPDLVRTATANPRVGITGNIAG